jgi:translation initiation factor IF-1
MRGFMSKEDLIELQGVVTEVLAGGNYKVKCGENHEVLARLNGKMRQYRIRVIAGDRVTVEKSHGCLSENERSHFYQSALLILVRMERRSDWPSEEGVW